MKKIAIEVTASLPQGISLRSSNILKSTVAKRPVSPQPAQHAQAAAAAAPALTQ